MTAKKETKSLQLFIAYAREDEDIRKKLETHLKGLERRKLISSWHDGKIIAGQEWNKRIKDKLQQADIVLFLVSASFIASDYCYEIEMNAALTRHAEGKTKVIPIITKPCHWNDEPFAKLQVLPNEGKAITTWTNYDMPLSRVATEISKIAKEVKKEKEEQINTLNREIEKLNNTKDALELIIEDRKDVIKNLQMQIKYADEKVYDMEKMLKKRKK
ncbi:MAG: toll/interleukin-1 receptor domain-containing protein, partial [Pseudomonadota bacterium]